mgnify:CR=1 FL=1
MQALILAISLVLFSTIKSNEAPTEIPVSKTIDSLAQLKEVEPYTCFQLLEDFEF